MTMYLLQSSTSWRRSIRPVNANVLLMTENNIGDFTLISRDYAS